MRPSKPLWHPALFGFNAILLNVSLAVTLFLSGLQLTLKQKMAFLMVMVVLFSPLAYANSLRAGIQYTPNSYRVGPGDILSMQVYHQPDLAQTEILVKEDGHATINPIGEVRVAGKSLSEIDEIVKESLSDLYIDPIVTITVAQSKPGTIYVAGAVKQPGMYQLHTTSPTKGQSSNQGISKNDLRLSNVLSNAGGVLLNADLSGIEVKKAYTGDVIHVNLWNMLKTGDSSDDILLQSGDSVFVPGTDKISLSDEDYKLLLRSSIGPGSFPVRIIGDVTTPGLYDLSGLSPNLNTVIAKAGGYKVGANTKLIAIRRFENDTATTLYVDLEKADTVLKPNDVVLVTPKKLFKAGQFMQAVAMLLSPFTSAASAAFGVAWVTGLRK